MDVFSQAQMRKLIESGTPPCVSIFMKTHAGGRDVRQDPIELKNLCRQAVSELQNHGMEEREATRFLEPVQSLIDDADFWTNSPSRGLAIFRSKDVFEIHHVPIEVEDMASVNSKFNVTPVIPLMNQKLFYVLALSDNAARLLRCTPHDCQMVKLPSDVALSMKDAIVAEDEHQTGTMRNQGGGAGPGSARVSTPHGHVSEFEASHQEDRNFYFRQLDDGVRRVMESADAPLILAAADSTAPYYRQASHLKNIVEGTITGNPEHVSNEDLHARAKEIMEPIWHAELNAMQERFGTMYSQKLATSEIKEIVRASAEGRVDTLILATGRHIWGRHDEGNNQVHVHAEPEKGDEDLVDHATMHTLLTSGRVVVVAPEQVPGKGDVAAILRY